MKVKEDMREEKVQISVGPGHALKARAGSQKLNTLYKWRGSLPTKTLISGEGRMQITTWIKIFERAAILAAEGKSKEAQQSAHLLACIRDALHDVFAGEGPVLPDRRTPEE